MRTICVRLSVSSLVVVMTGACVAVAGPIGLLDWPAPLVRSVVGPDYRWVLPYSMLSGAVLLTAADIIGRVVLAR